MDYTLDSLDAADNTSVIFRGIVGSRAYGTANANSDTDIRGVFVVPSAEYVRLVPPPKQVLDTHNDKTYYTLLRFCELATLFRACVKSGGVRRAAGFNSQP